jgi:uncharacterized membrane protein
MLKNNQHMNKRYLAIFFLVGFTLLFGRPVYAVRDRQNITDWYIQNFETNILVNKDSSLLITENITADCGDLPSKHGIFRVLPTQVTTDNSIIKNPIELVSITDFNGNPYKYQTIKDGTTITWKIGDSKIIVNGVNEYKIVYKVKNAIRFENQNFDELYWNLSGNFWDIDIDNFSAHILFPSEINSQTATVDYYTGAIGSKDKSLATYSWSGNTLNFISANINQSPVFHPGEGVTVSVIFPKNIFLPYMPTFMEKYGDYFLYLLFLIPTYFFIFAFKKWRKFGKDPKMKTPIPPEFGIPENITPIQMGMILSHGSWKNSLITATLIDLAVRKFIVIEQKEKKILFLKNNEIILKKNNDNYNLSKVTQTEKEILDSLFKNDAGMVHLSTLMNSFYKYLPGIGETASNDVIKNNWIVKEGNKYMGMFIFFGFLLVWLSFWALALSVILFSSIFLSGIIFLIFGFIMPKRTQAGVDLLFKIKGFELYMKTAEKYRQQFYEKENIFDKFLPYAIVFGIAELWAKKMELIYGEDYFKNYHPVWLVGTLPTNFDLQSFTHQLNSITTSVSQNTGGSSGAGGGGGSGGGGGGGGGGGW